MPPFLCVGYSIHNMPYDAHNDTHNCLHARSYNNLDKARAEATQKNGYNSESTRNIIQSEFLSRFGRNSYTWQMDVAEALILGLDSVVIAGTGAGKMMPFVMPLFLRNGKKILIISPLKVLQADQVCKGSQTSW